MVAVLVVAFVGLALVKPWGGATEPRASSASAAPSPISSTTAASEGPAARPDAFTLPVPTGSGEWTGIAWRQLASDDPLTLIRSVAAWRGGFVAVGYDPTNAIAPTPVWSSSDGVTWQLIPVGTPSAFWAGVQVVSVAAGPDGVVALTSPGAACDGYALCQWYGPPVTTWTSTDGLHWTPHAAPELGTATTWRGAALAGGPAGLVAVSMGTHAEVARSADGTAWRGTPLGTLPPDIAVGVVQGTPTGYVLAGTTTASAPAGSRPPTAPADTDTPGTLWSADSRTWRVGSVEAGISEPEVAPIDGPALRTLAAGNDGLVLRTVSATDPGVDRWWRSADGRSWQSIPAYGALDGATIGSAASVALAGDGRRIVVVRGSGAARAWASSDGRDWTPLQGSGTPPVGTPNRVLVLPGGVLVSTGTTTWYGTAATP